jgi:hypothetical protein
MIIGDTIMEPIYIDFKFLGDLNMKKLFILGIFVLSILLLTGGVFAAGYTFDGDIDPAEFSNWTMAVFPMPMDMDGVYLSILINTTTRNRHIEMVFIYWVEYYNNIIVLAYEIKDLRSESMRFFELHPISNHYGEVLGTRTGSFKERYQQNLQSELSKLIYISYEMVS